MEILVPIAGMSSSDKFYSKFNKLCQKSIDLIVVVEICKITVKKWLKINTVGP
jgi:hypothetical protein